MEITQSNNPNFVGKEIMPNRKEQLMKIGKSALIGRDKIVGEYAYSQVSEFKLIDETSEVVNNKSAMGTIGGAVVGGVLTGGVGAIVGGLAGGNNVKKKIEQQIGMSFEDGTWVVANLNTNEDEIVGRLGKAMLAELSTQFASTVTKPF